MNLLRLHSIMAKRQKEWARKTRDKIFNTLGRVCAKCGSEEDLEFDIIHPNAAKDHHEKLEWSHRMSVYRKALDMNNLQILCSECNGRKNNALELFDYKAVDCPF